MPRTRFQNSWRYSRTATIGGKLAALTGAAGGLAAVEAQAAPLTYVPTVGVAAAQGIPGFAFVSSTNVTSGTLRPPTSSPGTTAWDVDGDATTDFDLTLAQAGSSIIAHLTGRGNNRLIGAASANPGMLANLPGSTAVDSNVANPLAYVLMTSNGANSQPEFPSDTPGQFGFTFTSGSNTFYGWGTLTIQPGTNRFTISEAYYNTVAGAGINVGEVPFIPVPEPSSMALLALGSAGVVAWRARRRKA